MGWRLEGRIRSSGEGGFHLGAYHPHSIRQRRTIDGNSIALHFGNAGDHQRGWERPRLARHIAHRGRPNTRLLEKLARDRFLDRLGSEEHTSELQSLMRISYAVFCLKKQNIPTITSN